MPRDLRSGCVVWPVVLKVSDGARPRARVCVPVWMSGPRLTGGSGVFKLVVEQADRVLWEDTSAQDINHASLRFSVCPAVLHPGIFTCHILQATKDSGWELLDSTFLLALPSEAADEVVMLHAQLLNEVTQYFNRSSSRVPTIQAPVAAIGPVHAPFHQAAPPGPSVSSSGSPSTSSQHTQMAPDPIRCYAFEHFFVPFVSCWAAALPQFQGRPVPPPLSPGAREQFDGVRRLMEYLIDRSMFNCVMLVLAKAPAQAHLALQDGLEVPSDYITSMALRNLVQQSSPPGALGSSLTLRDSSAVTSSSTCGSEELSQESASAILQMLAERGLQRQLLEQEHSTSTGEGPGAGDGPACGEEAVSGEVVGASASQGAAAAGATGAGGGEAGQGHQDGRDGRSRGARGGLETGVLNGQGIRHEVAGAGGASTAGLTLSRFLEVGEEGLEEDAAVSQSSGSLLESSSRLQWYGLEEVGDEMSVELLSDSAGTEGSSAGRRSQRPAAATLPAAAATAGPAGPSTLERTLAPAGPGPAQQARYAGAAGAPHTAAAAPHVAAAASPPTVAAAAAAGAEAQGQVVPVAAAAAVADAVVLAVTAAVPRATAMIAEAVAAAAEAALRSQLASLGHGTDVVGSLGPVAGGSTAGPSAAAHCSNSRSITAAPVARALQQSSGSTGIRELLPAVEPKRSQASSGSSSSVFGKVKGSGSCTASSSQGKDRAGSSKGNQGCLAVGLLPGPVAGWSSLSRLAGSCLGFEEPLLESSYGVFKNHRASYLDMTCFVICFGMICATCLKNFGSSDPVGKTLVLLVYAALFFLPYIVMLLDRTRYLRHREWLLALGRSTSAGWLVLVGLGWVPQPDAWVKAVTLTSNMQLQNAIILPACQQVRLGQGVVVVLAQGISDWAMYCMAVPVDRALLLSVVGQLTALLVTVASDAWCRGKFLARYQGLCRTALSEEGAGRAPAATKHKSA